MTLPISEKAFDYISLDEKSRTYKVSKDVPDDVKKELEELNKEFGKDVFIFE